MVSKKVVHLTSVHPPFDTRIFHKECKTLVKKGYEVVLIVPHTQDEIVEGVKIIAIKKNETRINRITNTAWQVFKTALRENGCIYHIHDPELLPWAQILRMTGRSTIYDMHENVPKSLLTKSYIFPFIRPFVAKAYRLLEKLLMFHLPVVYAETSYQKDYLWINQYETVLNLPIVEQFLNINNPKNLLPTVAYLGGVTPERGSLITLDALHNLKEKGYKVAWQCLGPVSSSHKLELIQLSQNYGLDAIYIAGYVPAMEGWRTIAQCSIGLAVLQPIPNYIESYPTKMFEYMALGLPVVVSNFPLYAEVVQSANCGLCVDPTKPQEVAEAIQWLIEHPQEAEAMGQRGKNAVLEKYNWQTEAQKLFDFYQKLT
ncbi:glycosyltransferase family 4 protein [Oscillatoria sp. HE19RPO]|uniref:glycosyltransferase family 4 protein n=1 Tax=Oscillatoria sp. HE19RPO TaxID=2954806 RepID=UPI0020C256BA|nr:glycosyltransferase family 4 protein [Oscillatoria sp. HE19RPO]